MFVDGVCGPVAHRECAARHAIAGLVLFPGLGEQPAGYDELCADPSKRGIATWLAGAPQGSGVPDRAKDVNFDEQVTEGQALTAIAAATSLRLTVAGHDLGGMVASAIAWRWPQACAGLVLSGTPLRLPTRTLTSVIDVPVPRAAVPQLRVAALPAARRQLVSSEARVDVVRRVSESVVRVAKNDRIPTSGQVAA